MILKEYFHAGFIFLWWKHGVDLKLQSKIIFIWTRQTVLRRNKQLRFLAKAFRKAKISGTLSGIIFPVKRH